MELLDTPNFDGIVEVQRTFSHAFDMSFLIPNFPPQEKTVHTGRAIIQCSKPTSWLIEIELVPNTLELTNLVMKIKRTDSQFSNATVLAGFSSQNIHGKSLSFESSRRWYGVLPNMTHFVHKEYNLPHPMMKPLPRKELIVTAFFTVVSCCDMS
ncbi:hypothetical protein CEXT_431231 [Caerostris extrusa]|uniref:Uncharacterized protein n=1 Tax=Caerostris extrusa TaxID=172846 RepID=A0AAV4UHT1_CAEEX|nr:hypothetical protein CEXT_431231 [Caerostris extrusa]